MMPSRTRPLPKNAAGEADCATRLRRSHPYLAVLLEPWGPFDKDAWFWYAREAGDMAEVVDASFFCYRIPRSAVALADPPPSILGVATLPLKTPRASESSKSIHSNDSIPSVPAVDAAAAASEDDYWSAFLAEKKGDPSDGPAA